MAARARPGRRSFFGDALFSAAAENLDLFWASYNLPTPYFRPQILLIVLICRNTRSKRSSRCMKFRNQQLCTSPLVRRLAAFSLCLYATAHGQIVALYMLNTKMNIVLYPIALTPHSWVHLTFPVLLGSSVSSAGATPAIIGSRLPVITLLTMTPKYYQADCAGSALQAPSGRAQSGASFAKRWFLSFHWSEARLGRSILGY